MSYIVYIKQTKGGDLHQTIMREMNKTMTLEQQLSKIDDYINWIKIEENYVKMREWRFMYKSEYTDYLDRVKWLITENHGLNDYDKNILNKIEKLK